MRKKVLVMFTAIAFLSSIALTEINASSVKTMNLEMFAENGSCKPKTDWICGLNGKNYDNKKYRAGGVLKAILDIL